MKKIVFLFLCTITIQNIAEAQSGQPTVNLSNIIPMSPQSAQLQRVNEITVNSAKGVPAISFNLYTASVGNLKIPITISYDASGIKYDDIPSAVGLKWSLEAGGQVSRSINGLPDESYYFPNQSSFSDYIFHGWHYNTPYAQDFLTDVGHNYDDIMHDDYSYNYLDKSGYLYFRTNKFWDSQNPFTVKIKSDSSTAPVNLKIIDEFGNTAYFDSANYTESSMPSYGLHGYVNPNVPSFGITAWYLSRVKAYNKEVATFDYDTVSYSYTQLLSQAYVLRQDLDPNLDAYNCNCGTSDIAENDLNNLFSNVLIKKITTPNEQVQFYYSTDNSLSIFDKRLDSITVKDKNDTVVNRIHLKYGQYSTVNLLRLDEVWNFSTTGDSLLVASFHYKSGDLNLLSAARDIFNYNNGASNTTLISTLDSDLPYYYPSADRSVNSSYITNGNLDTIYYHAGGKAAFSYSPNQISDYYGPGVRVDSIKYLHSDNSLSSQIEYSYFDMQNGFQYDGPGYYGIVNNDNPKCPLKTLNSEIVISPTASPFYYGSIAIRRKGSDSSRTELAFESFVPELNCYGKESPVLSERIYCRNNNPSDILRGELNTYSSVTIDSLGIDWLYASDPYLPYLPAQVYTLSDGNHDNTNDCAVLYDCCPGLKAVLKPRTNVLVSVTTTEFDQNNSSQSVTNTVSSNYNDKWQKISDSKINSKGNLDSTYYTYLHTNAGSLATALTNDNLFGLVNKTTRYTNGTQMENSRVSFSSHSSIILPDSFFVKSLSNSELFDKMITAYDTSGQITEVDNKHGFYTSLLRDYNNQLLVAEASNAKLSQVAYTSFEADSKGGWTYSGTIDTDSTAPTGVKRYSLSGSHDITKSSLTSATYIVSYWSRSGSPYTVNGSSTPTRTGKVIGNWTYYEHEVTGTSITISGSSYIDEVRLYPKGAQMTTYTYQPLVGLSAQCDVDNRISYYEYDAFGRVRLIRDQDKNVIKVFDYQYKQSQNQ